MADELIVEGNLGRVVPRTAPNLLRLASGLAFFQWLFRVLLWTFSVRRRVWIRVGPEAVELRVVTRMLGKELKRRETTIARTALLGVTRETGHPASVAIAGAAAFGLAVLLAGSFAYGGWSTGSGTAFVVAALVILVGVGLDFGIDTWLRRRQPVVAVELHMVEEPSVRLVGVDAAVAQRLMGLFGSGAEQSAKKLA